MTRSFVIVIGILIVFILSLHFWVQWDLKRFKASLPSPATKAPAEAENAIENQKKINAVSGVHSHGGEWHTIPAELARDKTREQDKTPEQPVPEKPSQLGVPNVEESEPIEDPVTVYLHAEKLELARLQEEVNDMADGFYNALEAQSISVNEANAIFEELNKKLKHLRERRHQWLREYAEHHGTEYQGPEHWVNLPTIDEAALQERAYQEAQEQGIDRGYIVLPRN